MDELRVGGRREEINLAVEIRYTHSQLGMTQMKNAKLDPTTISRNKKDKHLVEMSEDEFRDKVVRPVFLRLGFKGGDELCGPTEEGKDTIFFDQNRLDQLETIIIQTKKGNVNLASKANQNLVTCVTELRTALEQTVIQLKDKRKVKSDKVYLIASGRINDSARRYIHDEIKDSRLNFMDNEEIVPLIDKHYPEFWWGIDADKFPYLINLKEYLIMSSDTISLKELEVDAKVACPVADGIYIDLYLNRIIPVPKKHCGQSYMDTELEEFPVTKTLLKTKSNMIRIAGEAGSGKTTLLRRIAYDACEKTLSTEGEMIPIIIKARDIEGNVELSALLAEECARLTLGNKPCFGSDELNNGKILVLVDALDEANSNDHNDILSTIINFNKKYPKCKIILTYRDYYSINNLHLISQIEKYNVSPINYKQAEKLLINLQAGKKIAHQQSQEMLRRLHDVHGIELNPLLVTVFAATSDYSKKDVPANITELFKKFTEMMLGRWDQRKGLSQQYQAPLKDYLLKRLGFELHSQNLTQIDSEVCKSYFSETLKKMGHELDLDVLFNEITSRSGLLKFDNNMLGFRHTLLQEFYAGRGVPNADFFSKVISDERWKHPIVFYFGEHPDRLSELFSIIEQFDTFDKIDLYKASIAIGVGAQACYLSDATEKSRMLEWVITSLSSSKDSVVAKLLSEKPEYHNLAFIHYYLYAREAVACDAIGGKAEALVGNILKNDEMSPEQEAQVFWYIVALIEIGELEKAKILLKKFWPKELRYLLSIHVGCFTISQLRTTPNDHKKISSDICALIQPKIEGIKKDVSKEMNTLFLEIRKGSVVAIQDERKEEGE